MPSKLMTTIYKSSIDAAKMFKSFEAEKEWNRKFWESRKRDDGNAKSDEGNLDKVTID